MDLDGLETSMKLKKSSAGLPEKSKKPEQMIYFFCTHQISLHPNDFSNPT